MKNPIRFIPLPVCIAMLGTAALLPAQIGSVTEGGFSAADTPGEESVKPPKEKKPKKDKPKSDKKEGKASDKKSGKKDKDKKTKTSAKDAGEPELEIEKDTKNDGDWCSWLQDKPGELYKSKDNPIIQSFRLGGRFQYQAYHTSGTDVRGKDFNDSGDEYRRFRIETKTRFLSFFDAEINVNLVDDRRFRSDSDSDLDWGYDDFDEASIGFDIGGAFGTGPFDSVGIRYGRMKLPLSEEIHQSSRRIYTIERSSLADKVGGRESRPTGVMLGLEKNDWTATLGVFSGEDDTDFIGGWNDGQVYYGSIEWQVTKQFRLLFDHAQNDQSGADDILGYAWANSLAAVYETKRWGTLVNLVYGDNGGAKHGNLNPLRQGDFHGVIVMPWYWLMKDKLQVVFRYQYAASDEAEGVRLGTRYARASHDPPGVDLDNGYGDEHHSFYLGLNYHLCGDNAKVMGGVNYEELHARTAKMDAITYMIAFRTFF